MELDSLGSAPIAGDNPAGEDVRSGPAFEALQAEIDRPNDTANPGLTEWSKVVDLAGRITAEEGKDLLVASYLAVGLMKQHAVPGFASGLKILRDMILTHWDGLFPPARRMRGRRNALQYWLDQCDEILRGADTAPIEQAAIDAMLQHIDEIDTLLREKDDEPPGVFRLASLVKGFPVKAAEAPEPPPAAPDETADASQDAGATTPSAAPVAPSTWDEAMALALDGLGRVRMAADFLIDSDPLNPLPYRASRWAAWTPIIEMPAADGDTTAIPPPDPADVEALANLVDGGQHETVLRFVEFKVHEAPFWLDLNHAQVRSLQSLGDAYLPIAAAVHAETSALVARLPGLEKLRFADGTPMASPDTAEWLATAGSGPAAGNTPAAGGSSRDLQQAIDAAAALAAQGETGAAAALLQRAIEGSTLARDRFEGRVSLCDLLLQQQALPNPWPYVRGILEDIDRHALEEWDPALALSGLCVVYAGISMGGEASAGASSADDVLQRIARIDFTQALRCSGAT